MPQSLPRFVILDRDGVVNFDSDQFIKTPDEWVPIAGSLEAIASLNQAGFRVVIASNQSGIGRGLFEMSALNAMHEKMYKALANLGGRVDAVFFCPHTAADGCDCRKPKPGLFEQIGERFGIELRTVPAVGDSLRDLEAGVAVGCMPHLVLTGKGQKTLEQGGLPAGTRVHDDLAAFARWLIRGDGAPAAHKPAVSDAAQPPAQPR